MPRRLVILTIGLLGLLPVATWLPSNLTTAGFEMEWSGWLSGVAIVLGFGYVLALASRRFPNFWYPGLSAAPTKWIDPAGRLGSLLIPVLALALYLAIARLVFSGKPLLIDEVVQVFQARLFAGGRLWEAADPFPAFRNTMHLVEHQGKVFSHFPPAGPAWLTLGELLGSPWVAVPLAGAIATWAWGMVLRAVEPVAGVRAAAFLLMAFAPFAAFMAGSHMNHTVALMWVLLGVAALVRVVDGRRPWLAIGGGFAFGMAVATRPADGIAFLVPAAIWLASRWRERRAISALGIAALGFLAPIGVMIAINAATTGSAFTSGYQLLWGPNVGLGFHPAPWGPPHTPTRGLELLSLYLFRLNAYLFEAPFPALVPALAALYLAPRLAHFDRYLLSATLLLLLGYFAYWFDGFYLGPRFMIPVVPAAALWTARLPGQIRDRFGSGLGERTVIYGALVAVVMTIAFGLPIRTRQYANGLYQMRWNADRVAASMGIDSAVVFVNESWGAQVLARLWAKGVSRPDAERFYRNIDLCALEETLHQAETARLSSTELTDRLIPLMKDSLRLRGSPLSPDTTERVLDGARYSGRCLERLRSDRTGIALLAPLLVARKPVVTYVRNLHELNGTMLARYPGRRAYLIRRPDNAEWPAFVPLDRDSVIRAGTSPQ